MRHSLLGATFVFVVGLGIASCSSSESSTPGAAGTSGTGTGGTAAGAGVVSDACAVFDVADISAAFGVTVARSNDTWPIAKTSDGLPIVQCKWEQGEARFDDYIVDFSVQNFATAEKAQQELDSGRVNSGSMSYQDVSGVGESAFFARDTLPEKKQASLYWRAGNARYMLGVVRLGGITLETAEASLKAVADTKF